MPGAWATALASVPDTDSLGSTPSVAPEHGCREGLTTIACWGRGDRGQLGDGGWSDRAELVEVVTEPPGLLLRKPCTGGEGSIVERDDGTLAVPPRAGFSCAVSNDDVLCWGANELGQLGDGTTEDRNVAGRVELPGAAAFVTCGGAHACAWASDGTRAWCWGSNDHGQLGSPSSELSFSPVPVEVDLFPEE